MNCSTVRTNVLLLVALFLVAATSILPGGAAIAQAAASEPAAYPDSSAGLESQFGDMVLAARHHDQAALRSLVEALAIPNAEQWFADHFDPETAIQVRREYADALSGFQSHVFWVMDFAKSADFGLRVQASEIPPPPADFGLESLLPRPRAPVQIENYRLSPVNGTHPPSWVSSFVYIDGRFRFVGGTYPFWAERLTSLRGLMALPPLVLNGRTVQGIAYVQNITAPGIAAVVQVQADVARKGHVSHVKVLSGEEPFITDAKQYLSLVDFDAIPKIPGLSGKKRWDIAVIFFQPKS